MDIRKDKLVDIELYFLLIMLLTILFLCGFTVRSGEDIASTTLAILTILMIFSKYVEYIARCIIIEIVIGKYSCFATIALFTIAYRLKYSEKAGTFMAMN
jgi:hypothetical protein